MFKKLQILAVFLLWAATVCCGNDKTNYNIAVIGDIHYDAWKYHDMSKIKHRGVPQSKHVYNQDGYFSWRNHSIWTEINQGGSVEKNTPLNIKMWEKYLPDLLDQAAAKARAAKVEYTFQLGDMIHGDCYQLNLHKSNLEDALRQLTSRFGKTLVVCGNHDTRGTFGRQAWNEVINPHLDKTVKNLNRKNSNYSLVIGKDLYLFYDVMNVDVEFFENAVKANPNCRYTFFISHVPLLPTGKHAVRNILSDDIARLLKLLESCNAIVISGHTHKISVVEYFNKANNSRINQFIINSTVRYPEGQLNFKEKVPSKDEFLNNAGKSKELWHKFYEGRITTKLYGDGTGYGILRVTDQGAFMDYHNLTQDKVYTYKLR